MDAEQLKRLIRERGESQAGIARLIGITPDKLSKTLAGKRNLKLGEADILRRYFGVDVLACSRIALIHTDQTTTGDPRPGRRHWVYGRARRPCFRCGTAVAFAPPERTPHGRETWWCPRCQPDGAGML